MYWKKWRKIMLEGERFWKRQKEPEKWEDWNTESNLCEKKKEMQDQKREK